MTNLIGSSPAAIAEVLAEVVDRPFRARQVARWIHHRDARSFAEMTDLPLDLRRRLEEAYSLAEPAVERVVESRDGSRKYLLRLDDGATVECVAMREGARDTLCLSSQTGCAVGCTFCVTGLLGAGRNLRPEEIVGQYRVMRRGLPDDAARVNLVFMGMGEPLLNRAALGAALEVLYETVSPRRITVSTAGIVPGIRWLGGLARRPKLALSLNATDQARRSAIMPITARWTLDELMREVRAFPLERGRRITFEYVLIADFNDALADAAALAALIRGIPSKVNVIPLNEDPLQPAHLRQPDPGRVNAFATAVRDAGLTVTVRWSKGRDVAAACGQLKGLHQVEARRQPAAAELPASTTADH